MQDNNNDNNIINLSIPTNGYVDYNKPYISTFITRVFNYYDGYINTFNTPAVLNIDYSLQYNSHIGGTSRNPNVVTIYPYILERYSDSLNEFYYNLIVTIIHELYHVDQDINYIKMIFDPAYAKQIEYTVEAYTYLYIANHQHEIAQQFGYCDPREYSVYSSFVEEHYETGQLYHRRDYYTHLISILRDIMYDDSDENIIIEWFKQTFLNTESIIEIIINQKMFILKYKDRCIPLAQLNSILEEEFFKYNLRSATVEYEWGDANTNVYTLVIKTNCSQQLYHIINTNGGD